MGCNAWNHPLGCDCGFGGDTGGYGGLSAVPVVRSADGRLWSPERPKTYESYVNPNALCPVCGADVYFYQSPYGGRVFFDDLGWPWPKHPCTDNGEIPHASWTYTIESQSPPKWKNAGWHPINIASFKRAKNGWRLATLEFIGQARAGDYLIASQSKPDLSSPILLKGPARNGVGYATWVDADDSGGVIGRQVTMVNTILEVVPRAVLDAALRSEVVAVAEVAVLLCNAAQAVAGPNWISDLPTTHVSLIRTWLAKSAENGSSFASAWLNKIAKAKQG